MPESDCISSVVCQRGQQHAEAETCHAHDEDGQQSPTHAVSIHIDARPEASRQQCQHRSCRVIVEFMLREVCRGQLCEALTLASTMLSTNRISNLLVSL